MDDEDYEDDDDDDDSFYLPFSRVERDRQAGTEKKCTVVFAPAV